MTRARILHTFSDQALATARAQAREPITAAMQAAGWRASQVAVRAVCGASVTYATVLFNKGTTPCPACTTEAETDRLLGLMADARASADRAFDDGDLELGDHCLLTYSDLAHEVAAITGVDPRVFDHA